MAVMTSGMMNQNWVRLAGTMLPPVDVGLQGVDVGTQSRAMRLVFLQINGPVLEVLVLAAQHGGLGSQGGVFGEHLLVKVLRQCQARAGGQFSCSKGEGWVV
jgi:hypothetical protein